MIKNTSRRLMLTTLALSAATLAGACAATRTSEAPASTSTTP
jgi:hypothetical protein